MNDLVRRVVVLGSGSAGLLVSLAMKKRHPDLPVVIVRSQSVPIIGVGEGATKPVTCFLHDFLQVEPAAFFKNAAPTWKLGIRFEWGPRKTFFYPFHSSADLLIDGVPHPVGFYAGDNLRYADPSSALMTHDKAFTRSPNGGPDMSGRHFSYHFENAKLVEYLEQLAAAAGIITIEDKVVDVHHEGVQVHSLKLQSGATETADLFVDCSGFASAILGKTLREPFISYKSTLFCDRAVVGGWSRSDETIKPYTTAQTMNAGWSWQIDHEHRINRGYVYSSSFISDADADQEFRHANPKLDNTHVVKFISGRYTRTWVGNVIGIGNSAAFVEPLEATALGSICMQAQLLAETLIESDRRILPVHAKLYNDRIARNTDSIRRFLAIHYKFNTLLDTPFWKECREKVDLAGAESVLEYYRETGPGAYWQHGLLDTFDFATMTGYLQLLVGQNVPYNANVIATPKEQKLLIELFARNQAAGAHGFSVKQVLEMARDQRNRWN